MVRYTVKFERQFTGLKKVANLPMSNSKRYSSNVAITRLHSPRAYTKMNPAQSHSPLLLITAGGVQLEYKGDGSTKTAGLETAKIVFNSIISTPGAKFMTMDY